MKTVSVTHQLPGGGKVRVTLTAENPTEEDFPILRKSTAQATGASLIKFASLFTEENI